MSACTPHPSYILLSFVSLHSFNPSSFRSSLLSINFSSCRLFFFPSCPPFRTPEISLFSPRSQLRWEICTFPSSRSRPLRRTWGAMHIRRSSKLQIGHKSLALRGEMAMQHWTIKATEPHLSLSISLCRWYDHFVDLSPIQCFKDLTWKNWIKCSPAPVPEHALTFWVPSWLWMNHFCRLAQINRDEFPFIIGCVPVYWGREPMTEGDVLIWPPDIKRTLLLFHDYILRGN